MSREARKIFGGLAPLKFNLPPLETNFCPLETNFGPHKTNFNKNMENLVLKSREAQKTLEFSNEMMIKLAFLKKLHSFSREARKILGVSPQKDIILSNFGQNIGGGVAPPP